MRVTLKKSMVRIAPVTKGTMESLDIPKPNQRRPQTSTTSALSVSPDKSVPAWAAPLEKALAEDIRKASASSTKFTTTADVLVRSEMARKSLPPRLGQPNQTQGPRQNPAASVDELSRNGQDITRAIASEKLDVEKGHLEDGALAWEMETTGLGIAHVKQGLQLQAKMLGAYTAKQLAMSTTTTVPSQIHHDHKMKIILVRAMEAELDLSKVATERELMAMSENEIDKFYEKVHSAHKHWWEAEQKFHAS
jgi:hypothetical protein